jgi:zinc protease
MPKPFNLLAVLALAACAHASPPPAAIGQVAAPARAGWAHESSDLRPDPAIRFGTLANGMRYAIQKNATPPGEASLRLRIDAGSLGERDDQRGIAHFIEHMMFNGTRNVPEGEFVKRLERHGLKFGPDTNASTGFEETVYMLDLPETDADTIDTGLFLLREVAGEALLETGAIDRERGIILSEERTRAGPQMRIFEDQIGFLLKGDLLPQRVPIGLPEIIRTATRERFAEFYQGYYRPERATLVATGDFDVDAIEAKIRALFGTWQGQGPAAPDPAPPRLAERGPETHLMVEPGGPAQVTISWVGPADLRPDSKALRAERLIQQMAFRIVNRRLQRLANSEAPPFIGAGISRNEVAERAELVQIAAVAQPGAWQKALAAIEQEQRRAVEHGFTQAELDREIAELHASLTTIAASAATRTNPALAERLVAAANDDKVPTAPADDLARFEEVTRGLTAARVGEAAKSLFAGEGPLVYMTSPTAVEGGEQALLAAFNQSRAAPVAAPEVQQAKAWPYERFGSPGAVVDRRELADLGTTLVRFANGVRLTVKPTKFRDDEILVGLRFGAGMLQIPSDRPSPAWGSNNFTQGGLGKLTFEEMQQVLAETVYGVGLGIGEDAFSLGGRTRPSDFARQMQILAAFATDPAWRPTGWNRSKASASTIHAQLRSTPGGVASRESSALLHSGDRRWAFPSLEEMQASSIADLRQIVAPALAGPMEVIVVGDVTVDEAIRQTAATFGALPRRGPIAVGLAPSPVRFPAPGLVRLTHEGRADQGLAMIAWPTVDFYSDQKRARTLNLLGQVLQLRLIDEIREKQGTTYSPSAGSNSSETFPGYGYMSARIEAPPERLEPFLADAARIARELAEQPVGEDELLRARRPLIENLQRQRSSSNGWWADALEGIQDRPGVAESIRVSIAQYQSITPAELQAAARQYLVDAKAWKMIVIPKAP